MRADEFFCNSYERVFTVLLKGFGKHIVFGVLKDIVEYALQPNNGIEGFYEVEGNKLRKVSKKELKTMLDYRFPELSEQLFKIY